MGAFRKKSGVFLSAGCIMYQYFLFYILLIWAVYAPNTPPLPMGLSYLQDCL